MSNMNMIMGDLENVKRSLKYLHNSTALTKDNKHVIDCLNHLAVNLQYLEKSIIKGGLNE